MSHPGGSCRPCAAGVECRRSRLHSQSDSDGKQSRCGLRQTDQMDIVDSARRSEMMSRIKARHTEPEIAVRRIAHGLGLRFRLHRKDLPGCPDLVFPRFRAAVFVHGCFWHRHAGCRYAYTPKTRVAFWTEKFSRNVARDRRAAEALRTRGWRVLVIWECEAGSGPTVEGLLLDFLRQETVAAANGLAT